MSGTVMNNVSLKRGVLAVMVGGALLLAAGSPTLAADEHEAARGRPDAVALGSKPSVIKASNAPIALGSKPSVAAGQNLL